jgi:hypothetical protein
VTRLALLLILLWPGVLMASTIEVIHLYQPLSLHGTDGVGEHEEVDELLQASVLGAPYALSGAIPEDLVKAVAKPHQIRTNTPGYKVAEANLVILAGLTLDAQLEDAALRIQIDVTNLAIPEGVDLTSRQILKMTILAIEKTLETYYSHGEEKLFCELEIKGTTEKNASLRDLDQKFTIGE